MGKYCFGIDVGGTSVKCGLFQTDGVLVEKWEIPTRKEKQSCRILQRQSLTRSQSVSWIKKKSTVWESGYRDLLTREGKCHVR